jgi:hypothetical protein
MSSWPKAKLSLEKQGIDLSDLEGNARQCIEAILACARTPEGNERFSQASAAWSLHRLTRELVNSLRTLAINSPEVLRPIAESSPCWPSFISPVGDFEKDNKALLELLGVAKKCSINVCPPERKNGKRTSLKTLANRVTVALIQELEVRRALARSDLASFDKLQTRQLGDLIRALPKFQLSSWQQWSKAGWKLLCESNGNHPEKNPDLKTLGEYRVKHSEQVGAQEQVTKTTGESNLRDGIRERLSKAFKSFAPIGASTEQIESQGTAR